MSLADRFTAFMDGLMGFKPEAEEMEFTVTESDLRLLVDMAEDDLILRASEYSDYPDQEERAVLERVWGILGRPLPDYFRRQFGWKEGAVV